MRTTLTLLLFLTFAMIFSGCAAGEDAAETHAGPPAPETKPSSRVLTDEQKALRDRIDNAGTLQAAKPANARPPVPTGPKVTGTTFGRGTVSAGDGLSLNVTFDANSHEDDSGSGTFSHKAATDAGTIDIEGEVQCLRIDKDARLAWVSGIVSKNRSSHPAYMVKTGSDVWFYVADMRDDQPAAVSLPLFKGPTGGTRFCEKGTAPTSDQLLTLENGALAIFP